MLNIDQEIVGMHVPIIMIKWEMFPLNKKCLEC